MPSLVEPTRASRTGARPGCSSAASGPRDRKAERGRRPDHDPGQDERVPFLVEVRGRPHHALARQALAGLLERVDHRVRRSHAGDEIAVLEVDPLDVGAVLLPDRLEQLHPFVVRVDRRRRVLSEHDRDRSVRGLLRHGDHQRRRRRDVVHEHLRMPVDAVEAVVRLQRELPKREDAEDVRLRRLQLRDLRLHVRGRRVVTDFRDDGAGPRAESLAQAGEQVAAVVVVLIEHCDLRSLDVRDDVLPVELSFLRVRRDVADRPRVLRVVAPEGRRARADIELRHAGLVEELADR